MQSGLDGLELSPEREGYGANQKSKRHSVIPSDVFAEIEPGENGENGEGDHFLNNFQLKAREMAIADAIGRNLEAVFGEGDEPAHDNGGEKRRLSIFQVAVPRDGHEDVGANQEEDGFHRAKIVSRAAPE
jgi:hypothetical protein